MTNATKSRTARTAIEIVAIIAAIALVIALPVTRVAVFDSYGAFRDFVAALPGEVLAGLTNAWNWIF